MKKSKSKESSFDRIARAAREQRAAGSRSSRPTCSERGGPEVWNVVAWGDVRECRSIESVIDEVREAVELGCRTVSIERQGSPNNKMCQTHSADQAPHQIEQPRSDTRRTTLRLTLWRSPALSVASWLGLFNPNVS